MFIIIIKKMSFSEEDSNSEENYILYIQQELKNGFDINGIIEGFAWDTTFLMYCSMARYYKATEMLLEQGADPNIKNKDGQTALHFAICFGPQKPSRKMVKILLEAGADPNIGIWENETALMLASRCNDAKIIKMLLDHNADIHFVNSKGETAMSTANKYQSEKAIEILEKFIK